MMRRFIEVEASGAAVVKLKAARRLRALLEEGHCKMDAANWTEQRPLMAL
jgi:hypothetical protein